MESEYIPTLRHAMSAGGTLAFCAMATFAIMFGSPRISRNKHRNLMQYWERIFCYLYLACIVLVQVGTFEWKEFFELDEGPDDVWEILWGAVGLGGCVDLLMAFVSRQGYRLHIHHALLLHQFFCMVCVANVIMRDQFFPHVVPMIICLIYGQWFMGVLPRHFQVAAHSASMSNDQQEWNIFFYGINKTFRELPAEEINNLRDAGRNWVRKLLRCFRK